MIAEEITSQIDSSLAQYMPSIEDRQQAFFAQYGRYFQGLPSCSQVPADGSPAAIDQWDTAPGYQGITWRQAWTAADAPNGDPPAMTSCIRIDQYDGPSGPGWTLTTQVLITGTLWQRTINHGPETWRDQPWTPTS